MNEPSQNQLPVQPQGAVNPQVTAKVTQALLAYRKFMETFSKFKHEEHRVFLEMIKKVEDKKIQDLRKKLAQLIL